EQRDRDAGHLQRGDVGADQVAGNSNAPVAQHFVEFAVDDVQLDQRCSAHAVDECHNFITLLEGQVVEDRLGQHLGDLVRRADFHPLAARLAVNADADLHLVLAQLEGGFAGGRDDARGQGHAHTAYVRVDSLAQLGDLLQVVALLGGSAADLLGEDGAAHAAAACGVEAVLYGDVVVDHDARHFDTLSLAHLGGHLEVHDVAGVVLDDVQHTCAAVDGFGGFQHLVGSGAGEDLAGAGGVQHSHADEAAVHGLVAAATARDDPYFALYRRIGADDEVRVVVHPDQIRVRLLNT